MRQSYHNFDQAMTPWELYYDGLSLPPINSLKIELQISQMTDNRFFLGIV